MKRQRGRGRKPSNPNNRSYESNGPDVKIRGNANQIFEKYLQYARDAQTSGDRVSAEAYYQHAEHYYRIMAANMPRERLLQTMEMDGAEDDDSSDEMNASRDSVDASDDDDNSGALDVVDGDGEQPEDLSAQREDTPREEGERSQRRRPRRQQRRPSGNRDNAQPEGGDDAGLRAMMARSAAPEHAEAEQAEG